MWDAFAPGCGPTLVPSPKSNRYEAIDPSGSRDPDPSATTASGAPPLAGVTVNDATGGVPLPVEPLNSNAPRSA